MIDLYFEASIPLIEGATLAESLVLDAGYRYSDYSFGPSTNTYKFAGNWVPVDSVRVRVRGSFQRAVRAPNVVELFEPASSACVSSHNRGDILGRRARHSSCCKRCPLMCPRCNFWLWRPNGRGIRPKRKALFRSCCASPQVVRNSSWTTGGFCAVSGARRRPKHTSSRPRAWRPNMF